MQKSAINYKTFTKELQNDYKGVRAISILRNKIVSLVLAITFLLSVPAYAYADDLAEQQPIKVQENSSDSVNKFNIYSNLTGYYPDSSELDIKVKKLGYTSATLVWSSETFYLSYTVMQFNVLTNSWDEVGAVSGNSFDLKNLNSNSEYRFAVTSTKTGECLGTVQLKTKARPKKQYKLVNMGLPNVSGKCKTYAYYKAVTIKSSPAYAVLNSGYTNGKHYKTHTDEKTGIRMVGDYYCVALGTYYGTQKGTKYIITLSTGKKIKVILCDTKSDRHTDSRHQYAVRNKDIVEFYVEKGKIPREVRGSYDALPQFHGDIVKIEKIIEK